MRIKFVTMLVLLMVVALGLFVSGCSKSETTASNAKQKYHCPMHPTYVSDRQGDCPICNMKLVPIKDDKAAAKPMAAAPDEKTAHVQPGQFYCPMHPNVVSNAPGLCPECNMKLVEKKDEPTGHEGHNMAASTVPVPGRVSVSLSSDKRQMIGLKLSKVERRELTHTVRTAAVVQHDETRYARISPRFAGWATKLHVNFTGAPVEKGQPLLTVYSPELFSAENEYLIAWRAAKQLKESVPAVQGTSADGLVESARMRLRLFEIGDEEVRDLEQRGKASSELLFRAPFSGHVLVKNAVEGKSFMAGDSLYEIADLSRVWLRAYVFEFEMPFIKVDQDAIIHFPYLNNESFPGKVTFIYPHIEPQSRRGEIRLELDNAQHRIRPDMWANVEIKLNAGDKLTVPVSAVINTGERFIAFVEGKDQHLEPREVKVGTKTDDYYEVISGLEEEEEVVTRALFLVDSESQLKAAIAGMGAAGSHQH